MIVNIKKFYTLQQAGRACLKRQLEVDEVNLPDYQRPLKVIKERTHKTFFQKDVDKHGFIMAVVKSNLP